MLNSLNNWFVRLKPDPWADLRLYCFPYAGGSVASFRSWQAGLPKGVELNILQLPGHGARVLEEPFVEVESLIQEIVNVFCLSMDRPYAIFGHSLGAMLAYEVTRAIQARGKNLPVHLFVSGRGAPQYADENQPIHQLPEDEFIERLRKYNGTPVEVLENRELMEIFLPVLRADFTLNETYCYQPGPPLGVPITAFGGLNDPRVSIERLRGWRELTTRSFALQIFPGDHFYLHTAETELLQVIADEIGFQA